MIVCMMDRILKLLETTEGRAAVISSQYDWSNAYERQNPSKTIQKFISLRIRSSLIPILIDFLGGRSMKVKFNGVQAGPFERQAATKILGVWIGEDPSCWERNTQEIKKRTYTTLSMLTKLKYAGLSRN